MRVDLILCDAAQADPTGAKVHMLGAGWNVAFVLPGQSLSPHSVVALFHVPWNDANHKHNVEFSLVDEDSGSVNVVQPVGGPVPVTMNAELEVGRPPGVKPGSELPASIAFGVGPGLPLYPDRVYSWVCKVKDQELNRATFQTVFAQAQAGMSPMPPA